MVWHLPAGTVLQTLRRHEGAVTAVAWHSSLLFTGGADRTLKVYQPLGGVHVAPLVFLNLSRSLRL